MKHLEVDYVLRKALVHVNSRLTLLSLALQLIYILQDADHLPSSINSSYIWRTFTAKVTHIHCQNLLIN